MFAEIRARFRYKKILPLIYDEGLRDAYTGVSVAGGQLAGKTVLVTGGTGGIGKALAIRFMAEGCHVIISGRDEKRLLDTISYLRTKVMDGDVRYITMDQSDERSIRSAVDGLKKLEAYIDILINNAGIYTEADRQGRFRSVDRDGFGVVWRTDLKGVVSFTDHIVREIQERGIDGRVINIASICARSKSYQYTPYGISKAALIGYSSSLERCYEDIVVDVIEPGSVATAMGGLDLGDDIARDCNVLHHPAMPEEIAALAAFLAGRCGRYLKGRSVVASACEVL